MKKLVALEPRVAGFKEYEDRSIEKNEVKINVIFASPKHGTEVVDFRGASPFIDEEFSEEWRLFMPRKKESERGIVFGEFQLGNMIVGKIEEVGEDVKDYQKDDIVCTYGPIQETLIASGIDNYKLRKLDHISQWKNAVCYDPAQFALSGLREAKVRAGDYVAVFGLGAIGQIAIQLAKKAGASLVIGIDPIPRRRELAEKYGADVTINPLKEDTGFRLKELTGKLGVDSVIETSGSAQALEASLRGIAYGGIISYVAFAKPFAAGFNLGREAHFNNAKIVFARASSEPNPDYPRWDRKRIEDTCWKLLMNGYLDCEDIIEPIVSFEQSAEAYIVIPSMLTFIDSYHELEKKKTQK
ncbi:MULTISPECIES: zinc-dependent alcohol dehydrogenase [unclassified Enterococcus]|jgi:threonine dehydrogenase-like Zn-dependent dehydrogenase|uniref:zinc-dependent alcohol dehydrogenase n=1 Tax=unclassified Enterococcus TaxID=2608891 RepID=UPI003D2CA781